MEPLTFQVKCDEHQALVRVSGDLDMTGVLRLEPALNEVMARGDLQQITLELSGLTSIDTMAMTLMIETYTQAQRNDLELRLRRGPGAAQPVLRLAAIDQVLALE
jgi:anti-anti-sigma factor